MKDTSRLTKKIITNKAGKRQGVWVKTSPDNDGTVKKKHIATVPANVNPETLRKKVESDGYKFVAEKQADGSHAIFGVKGIGSKPKSETPKADDSKPTPPQKGESQTDRARRIQANRKKKEADRYAKESKKTERFSNGRHSIALSFNEGQFRAIIPDTANIKAKDSGYKTFRTREEAVAHLKKVGYLSSKV